MREGSKRRIEKVKRCEEVLRKTKGRVWVKERKRER